MGYDERFAQTTKMKSGSPVCFVCDENSCECRNHIVCGRCGKSPNVDIAPRQLKGEGGSHNGYLNFHSDPSLVRSQSEGLVQWMANREDLG